MSALAACSVALWLVGPEAMNLGLVHAPRPVEPGDQRKVVARQVSAGGVLCARCGKPIEPGEPFDLGHVDGDRTRYQGAEHRACNRATAGRRRLTSRRW